MKAEPIVVSEQVTATVEEAGDTLVLKATMAREEILEIPGATLGLDKPIARVRRSAEALREALPSFQAAPLMLGHHDANRANLATRMAGYPVQPVRMVSEGVVGGAYRLTSAEAIEQYQSGKARMLSPAYSFKAVPAPSGADYDASMVDIQVDHIAQVPRGKNGPSIRLSEEDDMTDVTLSEESAKTLADRIVEGMAKLFKRSEKEPDDEKSTEVRTREQQDAEVEQVKRLFKDKALVQPLLNTDKARTRVQESEDSLEVLGIALDIEQKEAEEQGMDALRGRVTERLANKGRGEGGTASWKGINSTESAEGVTNIRSARDKFYAEQAKQAFGS